MVLPAAGFCQILSKLDVSSGGFSVSEQTETDLMFRLVGLQAFYKNIGFFVRGIQNHCTLPISCLLAAPLLSRGAARRHEIGKSWVVFTLVPA